VASPVRGQRGQRARRRMMVNLARPSSATVLARADTLDCTQYWPN